MDNRPIGVFDSGLGGLTAVKALHQLMPEENIVYFGDTGRLPYGTRSRRTLLKYIAQDISFLRRYDCKLILAACGTVSSNITPELAASAGVPFFGVVGPAVEEACAATRNGRIGVIATAASIRSGAYQQAVADRRPGFTVTGKACPLLVPLVENGFIEPENEITEKVARIYLEPLKESGVDTLILGCTHFPLIYDIIDRVMEHQAVLVDSGNCLAGQAQRYLTEHSMSGRGGRISYFVTDSVEGFSEVAALFLGGNISGDVEWVSLDSL